MRIFRICSIIILVNWTESVPAPDPLDIININLNLLKPDIVNPEPEIVETARRGDFVPWQQYPDVIYPEYVDPEPEISSIPDEPSPGQRCRGRNFGERRCCTPRNPCDEGEGDCDGAGDGGQNDGNTGCKGSLVCGSNNCKQFGTYYHEKDDCCEKIESTYEIPDKPPYGQRCSGRNFGERRCCTPENPCDEGEGDCDGAGDGGQNDGNTGCKGSLICGSNNCKQFGTYFHEKDDCCQKQSIEGWTSWTEFTQCSKTCGGGKKSRKRVCLGNSCKHRQQPQERNCNMFDCPSPQPRPWYG